MASFTMASSFVAQVPNALTIIRICSIPLFVAIFLSTEDSHWMAGVLFGCAAATDWLDGYIARRWDLHSKFGAFLDPVADKLIVTTALVLLVGETASYWITIPAIVICARELFVSALREWMADIQRRTLVDVTRVGKVKTTFQMIAIFLLLCDPVDVEEKLTVMSLLGVSCLYIATIMTIWSMCVLLKASWTELSPSRNQSS